MGADTAKRIAELNDRLRTALGICCGVPGMVVMTRGIADLDANLKVLVLKQVRAFSDFTEDNDPYGEHDFGALDIKGAGKVFWKIDYYADAECQYGSEAPEDPEQTFRMLTIMLAGEY